MTLDTSYEKRLQKTAMKAEMLDVDTEYELAVAWRDHKDEDRIASTYKCLHALGYINGIKIPQIRSITTRPHTRSRYGFDEGCR